MSFNLVDASYGKAQIRVAKTIRLSDKHVFKEFTVAVLLKGPKLEETYLTGNNRYVIPTDTIKNTTYVVASKHSLESPESFAESLAQHFFSKYSHVEGVSIDVQGHHWERMNIDGKPHPHAFLRGGPETRLMEFSQQRGRTPTIIGGFTGLAVLKTCGSAFKDFHRCELTTLPDAADRLLATSVTAKYEFNGAVGKRVNANEVYDTVRQATLDVFAKEFSLSVQETLFKIGKVVLQTLPQLESISFSMPNIHIFEYPKFKVLGVPGNETFIAYTDPSGSINGRVVRSQQKAKL